MTLESPPVWLQQSSYGAEQTRRALFFGWKTGVNNASDLSASAPASGMSVNVSTGEILVTGTSTSTQGTYYGRVSAQDNEAVATASASNPRIDALVATVDDAAEAGSSNDWKLQVVTGTPTAGATLSNLLGAPTIPASSEIIAYILVPANATSISSADLSDQRSFAGLAKPYGHLVGSSPTTIAYDSWTELNLAVSFTGGGMQTASNALQVPKAGIYKVEWAIAISSSSTGYMVLSELYQNGSPVKNGSTAYAGVASIPAVSAGSSLIECAAGDVLSLWGYQTHTTGQATTGSGAQNFLAASFDCPI